ncbi:MAG: response regulator [Cyclobacteriaceae bacterium]|nr:response regulator [Cyclobacteriaceae bacterium SS2]
MNKKILVAEDSSVIQNLTKRVLTMQQYEVVVVKNGAQVIDKLSNDKYDLVLLDIHMPVMDGMECAKKIRSFPDARKDIPIIAITGNANNYSLEDFKNTGINDYLPKPLNYDNLVEVVKKYLQNEN